MNPKVDVYFQSGCGRCELFATPQCKVHNWTAELEKLRKIVLNCGLKEELKWGVPCYVYEKNNVVIIGAFKEYCCLSFFKGVLLIDSEKILTKQGENTQSGRIVKFTDVGKIIELESVLRNYIYEAVEIEKAGLKVEFKPTSEYSIPEELIGKFVENPTLKIAFEALTPGRQRAYLLHFSQPKQSKTREARIEKYMPQILIGKGINDL